MEHPLHLLAAVGTLAHHVFELAAGVGLVFQPELGLAGSGAFWAAALGGWMAVAVAGSASGWTAPLALLAGISVAGVGVHFALWPWRLRRGLPWLTAAEGLRARQLVAYNLLLYAWGAVTALAVAVDTPGAARLWALPGLLAALLFRVSARYHVSWAREQAVTNPAWWNRAFARRGEDA